MTAEQKYDGELIADEYAGVMYAIERLETVIAGIPDCDEFSIWLDIAQNQMERTVEQLNDVKKGIKKRSSVLEYNREIREKYRDN